MRSNLASTLAAFSDYLSNHEFDEIERKTDRWGEEALFRSPNMNLRIVISRGDVGVEGKPINSDESWYDVQSVLEMVAGATPKLLDTQNASLLAAEMESAHDELVTFFSLDQSDRSNRFSLWREGSYWGNVLKMRAARGASAASKPWWKFW